MIKRVCMFSIITILSIFILPLSIRASSNQMLSSVNTGAYSAPIFFVGLGVIALIVGGFVIIKRKDDDK